MNIPLPEQHRIHEQIHSILTELFPQLFETVLLAAKALDIERYKNYQYSVFHGHYPEQQFLPDDFNHTQEADALIKDYFYNVLFLEMAENLGIDITDEDLE